MIFTPTKIAGVWIVAFEKHADARGYFARTWCQREFESHGLNARLVQCSMSHSARKGTLRGLHYQAAPHEEAKLVRCTRGAIFGVALDLRPASPTFKDWIGIELDTEAGQMLYIAEGLAHGFQTLWDETEVAYHMSEFFHPETARGVRWNDPAFGIAWPACDNRIMSDRDAGYPDFVC
ncbi:MAG: dTDP-4-dehydrorhamnose 3,5-epimerase [Verrucomicrobiales bacterium]|nr:dTDP-4-dehydrorhamnose 3,5-epimerase [Verrucomicrobiales bacterium]